MRIIEDTDLLVLTPAYEWDIWLSGQTIMLTKGEDFHIDAKHLLVNMRRKAKERGLKIAAKTNDLTRTIVFRSYPEGTQKPHIPNALTITTQDEIDKWTGKQVLACKGCSKALHGGNMYMYGGYCSAEHQLVGETP